VGTLTLPACQRSLYRLFLFIGCVTLEVGLSKEEIEQIEQIDHIFQS
jgi:hypothetical protein